MISAAVIGGGTAGYMAAAHLSRSFPEIRLHHVYDPRIPTIGVGEGTVLTFPRWLSSITGGVGFEDLQARCHMTRKEGILFEGWGRRYDQYFHHFFPMGSAASYHLSAEYLVGFLRDYVRAEQEPRRVTALESNSERVRVAFEEGADLEVDLCLDARGFPRTLDPERHLSLDMIPTNAALLRQTPQVRRLVHEVLEGRRIPYDSATRSIARPHGWIFVIPLASRTSYGYIHNRDIARREEVTADFDDFFAEEGVEWDGTERFLGFPTFTAHRYFDGALMEIGNRASFIEPLEATAIGFIVKQLMALEYWPLQRWAERGCRFPLSDRNLETFNRHLRDYARKLAWFVTWHYAEGSAHDTPFWREAVRRCGAMMADPLNADLLEEAKGFLARAASLPDARTEREAFSEAVLENLGSDFSQFPVPSFAQVGRGMGHSMTLGSVGRL